MSQHSLFKQRSGGDRQARIDRYVSALRDLRAETRGKSVHVSSSNFAKSHSIGKSFLSICAEMNLISRRREGRKFFISWVYNGDIDDDLAAAILDQASDRVRTSKKLQDERAARDNDSADLAQQVRTTLEMKVDTRDLHELLPFNAPNMRKLISMHHDMHMKYVELSETIMQVAQVYAREAAKLAAVAKELGVELSTIETNEHEEVKTEQV